MFRSDYTWTRVSDNHIHIVDRDTGGKSVTNDIENVLADITAVVGNLSIFRITYTDTLDNIDEVVVKPDGTFSNFKFLNGDDIKKLFHEHI